MDNDESLNSPEASVEAESTTNMMSGEDADAAPTISSENEKPKGKKRPLIIVIVLLLIIGIGVGVFLMISNNNSNNEPEETADGVVEEEKEEIVEEPEEEEEEKVAKTALLPMGQMLRKKLSEASGAKYNDFRNEFEEEKHIVAIKRAKELPEKRQSRDYDITDSDSEAPIYLWYEETDAAKKTGTIYFYSEAETIYADSNMRNAFGSMVKLSDISGLAEIDVSKVENMDYLFFEDKKIKTLDALEGWNTSNLTEMSGTFVDANVVDISGLAGWDVSHVKKMSDLFRGNEQITDISALKKWDTAQVESLDGVFSGCTKLADISPLSDWNTSKNTLTSSMFEGMPLLKNISALKNWDMSNVYHASGMFSDDSSLEDLSPIANWNMKKLEYAYGMFQNTGVSDATVLDSWNVSSLKDDGKEDMFDGGVKTPKWY